MAGDIVWCRFPHAEFPTDPGPKARPGLVRGVARSPDGKIGAVEISYGTSKIIGRPPHGLIISENIELAACGLTVPTCFQLDLTRRLPWTEEFFTRAPAFHGLVMGHLPDAAKARLRAATRR